MRWKCKCVYDGTDFTGWQRQHAGSSVQNILEDSLRKIFKTETLIHGSGRTDAGVHANGQIFHFDGEWAHSSESLERALQCCLPETIHVSSIEMVANDFHARYWVKRKVYEYHIYDGIAPPKDTRFMWSSGKHAINVEAMIDASKVFVGEHDFTAFSAVAKPVGTPVNPIKTIYSVDFSSERNATVVRIEGGGFLYKMVRRLVGGLVAVSEGKLNIEKLRAILEGKERVNEIITMPAKGLFLEKVIY